jgi:hypothetical protein
MTGHDEERRSLKERRAARRAEARRPWWDREGRMSFLRRGGVLVPRPECVPYSGDRTPLADFLALADRMMAGPKKEEARKAEPAEPEWEDPLVQP